MRVPIPQYTKSEAILRRGMKVWVLASDRLTKGVIEEPVSEGSRTWQVWLPHLHQYVKCDQNDIRTLPWQWPVWRWRVLVITEDLQSHRLLAEGPTARELLYVGDDAMFAGRRFCPKVDPFQNWRRPYDTKPPIPYEWAYRVSNRFTQPQARRWHEKHRIGW